MFSCWRLSGDNRVQSLLHLLLEHYYLILCKRPFTEVRAVQNDQESINSGYQEFLGEKVKKARKRRAYEIYYNTIRHHLRTS